ncbi:MAG: Fic family protein [Gammaproteobacteria bacterium]|nr:Fic family protein [Gammaproteobacteria bacterium]
MNYKPPFDITPEIIDLISQISEKIGFVKRDFSQASPQLRKQNRIKTITGTLAIEGNTLNEQQISAVLEGKKIFATQKELAEVKGAIAAYDKLDQLNPSSLDDLLHAHKLMMDNVIVDVGVFRKKPVGVYKNKQLIHTAPPANRVMNLMTDLLYWQQHCDHHPLIISSVFHYEFEYIHPFMDGNGRMGRLWQTLILSQWQALFMDLPLESIIKQHQQDYYHALALSDKAANSTQFIHFMLQAILKTLAKNAPVNASLNAPVNGVINLKGMKTPEAILALIQADTSITRQQMAQLINKDIRTIARAIKKLQDQNKLKRIGSDKTGHWQISF